MRRSSYKIILMTSLFTLTNTAHMYTHNCGKDEYNRCITLADPLIKDPHFIYPGNLKDIDNICRTWTLFVDCTKKYTEHCFEESKRKAFNKAVENSIELVHQMCTSPQYQTEYLKHATCLRATLFEDSRCGKHYRSLASYVSNDTNEPGICCTHHRFRECVLDQTRRTCNQDDDSFTQQLLDKAFGFFRNQCIDFAPTQEECPGYEYYSTMATNKWQQEKGKVPPSSSSWPSTKRQDDVAWSTSMVSERTSRVYTERTQSSGSFSTPTWKVPESTKKTDTSYMTNVIDEPNQQGLGSENAGLRLTAPKLGLLFICFLMILLFNRK
ncbi:uncharacterized protein LOC126901585 isoform X2 [Daktulosphaira vitifoliae]|nr:uncharacterized protein LOC126901585 isoform X2 [Daktulosphaira vitifoliae]XP_050534107.1 uncharacterized protein LOC126901585 isoform X2 [Daktulosphaira vitifoliae]